MLPTFIIGGTLPSGTGHLYGLLRQHHDVYLAPPMQPECNFFFKTNEYEKGLGYYEQRWFSGVRGERAIGERSSLLLFGDWAAERIARNLPATKLIFLLRNPVDRAYANYRFTALSGFETLSFEDALEQEKQRILEAHERGRFWGEIQPHAYFAKGLYHGMLMAYTTRFPAEQLLVMRSDELLRQQVAAMAKIFRFLGVDDSFPVADFAEFSSPAVIDVERQAELRREYSKEFDASVQRIREQMPPETVLDELMRANVHQGYEKLSVELRKHLTARYRDANEQLAPMVPFGIEDWLP
jgi:hypothetical protein